MDNAALVLELHRLRTHSAAIDILLTTAIVNLVHISPSMRKAFEELLGSVRVFNATAVPGSTDLEVLTRLSFLEVDRILTELSQNLDKPLVPRAVLGTVPPISPD